MSKAHEPKPGRVATWTPKYPAVEGVEIEAPSLQEVERGWRFLHILTTMNQIEAREGLAFARALGDLLMERGFVSREELQGLLNEARAVIEERPVPKVMLAQGADKYAQENNVLIDCLEYLPLCRARCCRYSFCLTEQDLDEGVARWDYGKPYWMRKRPNGYCVHCDPDTYHCHIFEYRPLVCRTYDCREDKRVWLDFERRVLAPLSTETDQTMGQAPHM